MKPTGKKELTDEQWDALLNQAFGDTVPAPKSPEQKPGVTPAPTPKLQAEPVQSPPVQTTAETSPPVPKKRKKRKLGLKQWIAIAITAAILITALGIFLYHRFAPTEEQKRCMEELSKWQTAQYYRLTHSVIYTSNHEGIYDENIDSVYKHMVSEYYYGGENNLSWSFFSLENGNSYFTGKAQKGENWFTYSSNRLSGDYWKMTQDKTPLPTFWIRNFSLDDVRILHQQTQQESENVTAITFAVMDKDPEAELYGKGPYYIQFMFLNDQMYAVSRYQTNALDCALTAEYFNFTELSPEVIAGTVQNQLISPQTSPYFYNFDSVIRNDILVRPVE